MPFPLLRLLAQVDPTQVSNIWGLGVIAVALVVGAGLTYRYTTVPWREQAAAERLERIASNEREREAYAVTTPALLSSNSTQDRLLDLLPSIERALHVDRPRR